MLNAVLVRRLGTVWHETAWHVDRCIGHHNLFLCSSDTTWQNDCRYRMWRRVTNLQKLTKMLDVRAINIKVNAVEWTSSQSSSPRTHPAHTNCGES